jgi:hypothetical protein
MHRCTRLRRAWAASQPRWRGRATRRGRATASSALCSTSSAQGRVGLRRRRRGELGWGARGSASVEKVSVRFPAFGRVVAT